MELTMASRIVLSRHARYRRFDAEGVVVNQATAEALVVNEVGARLLEHADGKTLGECAAAIAEEFDEAPAIVERDVLEFARELVRAGVADVVKP